MTKMKLRIHRNVKSQRPNMKIKLLVHLLKKWRKFVELFQYYYCHIILPTDDFAYEVYGKPNLLERYPLSFSYFIQIYLYRLSCK